MNALIDRTVRSFQAMKITHVLRGALRYAPGPIQRWGVEQERRWKIRNRTRLVPEKELASRYRQAFEALIEEHGASSIGDYLEFGVYNGTSLITCYRVLQELGLNHVRLFGFDSFEGLPASAAVEEGGHWQPGQFKSDYAFTREVLDFEGIDWNRVFLIKGYFNETLTPDLVKKHNIKSTSLVMVDCDLSSSTLEALTFCRPFLTKEAFVFFDDWFPLADRNMGEKQALDEFSQAHPEIVFEPLAESYGDTAKLFRVSQKLSNPSLTAKALLAGSLHLFDLFPTVIPSLLPIC